MDVKCMARGMAFSFWIYDDNVAEQGWAFALTILMGPNCFADTA